MINIKR